MKMAINYLKGLAADFLLVTRPVFCPQFTLQDLAGAGLCPIDKLIFKWQFLHWVFQGRQRQHRTGFRHAIGLVALDAEFFLRFLQNGDPQPFT